MRNLQKKQRMFQEQKKSCGSCAEQVLWLVMCCFKELHLRVAGKQRGATIVFTHFTVFFKKYRITIFAIFCGVRCVRFFTDLRFFALAGGGGGDGLLDLGEHTPGQHTAFGPCRLPPPPLPNTPPPPAAFLWNFGLHDFQERH